jgi:hypothetical protein
MWSGARSFEGRRVSVVGLAVGPALWLCAFQSAFFAHSVAARISLVAAISAAYALLAARELWYARDRDLLSRWPTLVLVVGHAGFLLARIPYAPDLASALGSGKAQGAAATVMAFEALFAAFCLPFLRVAMARERAELAQRLAAETRLPHRRAEPPGVLRAWPSLARALRGRAPAGGAAAVRSGPLQVGQRHRRPTDGQSGTARFLRSGRRAGPAGRPVRPAWR